MGAKIQTLPPPPVKFRKETSEMSECLFRANVGTTSDISLTKRHSAVWEIRGPLAKKFSGKTQDLSIIVGRPNK